MNLLILHDVRRDSLGFVMIPCCQYLAVSIHCTDCTVLKSVVEYSAETSQSSLVK